MFIWPQPIVRIQFFIIMPLIFLMMPNSSIADCSCQKANPYSTFIGSEYMATSCPSTNDLYYYINNAIECPGTTISIYASWGDTPMLSPDQLSNFIVSQGYRVLRNVSGTHMMSIHTNFQGTVAGVNMAGKPVGIYYTDPVENFDSFCTWSGPNCDNCPDDPDKTEPGECDCGNPETDGDGDGDIDCIGKEQNRGNPPCPTD